MRIMPDRGLNPMLAAILLALAAGWIVSAVGAANYARRHADAFGWSKKQPEAAPAKRQRTTSYADSEVLA